MTTPDTAVRTCDQCATSEVECLPIDDCNICLECLAFHQRAIDAAAEVLARWLYRDPARGADPFSRRAAELVVEAYTSFTDERAEGDRTR